MKVLKHIAQQPFVAATALAALMHSTWSLGTLFAGTQPEAGVTVAFIGWIVPALLIAFALDIGMLATATDIRNGQRSKAKYATFGILSVSMFYMQWIYIAHHMPQLALGEGVSAAAMPFATGLRDAALWVIPSLLPLSTLLYTFSTGNTSAISANGDTPAIQVEAPAVANLPAATDAEATQEAPALAAPRTSANGTPNGRKSTNGKTQTVKAEGAFAISCPACEWQGSYQTERSATNALLAHKKHCTGAHVSANGHSQEALPI